MTSSLPVLNQNIKNWLNQSLRIDKWSVDMPSAKPTLINGSFYPANSAIQIPPTAVEFEKTSFGLHCKAEFNFRVVYRISRQLPFDSLPVNSACAIINNLYFDAVGNPAMIDKSIVSLMTPRDGIDLQIGDPEEEGKDWLLFLNPQFYIEFRASRAVDSDLNPPITPLPSIPITQLDIATYRGDLDFSVVDTDSYNLDRLFHSND